MSQAPLSLVKQRFESKEKLVAAVEKLATGELWLGRVNPVKGLKRASNKKLLRLHDLIDDANKRFGSRDKLIQTIAALAEREKDTDWAANLRRYPLPRLLDLHRSLDRAAKRRAASGQPEKKPRKEKKPMVKKPSKKAPAEAAKAEAPVATVKTEARKAEPAKSETKKSVKAEKAEAKSKPTASKPAASKTPVKKTAAKKATKDD